MLHLCTFHFPTIYYTNIVITKNAKVEVILGLFNGKDHTLCVGKQLKKARTFLVCFVYNIKNETVITLILYSVSCLLPITNDSLELNIYDSVRR
jgi:hypothetical protein